MFLTIWKDMNQIQDREVWQHVLGCGDSSGSKSFGFCCPCKKAAIMNAGGTGQCHSRRLPKAVYQLRLAGGPDAKKR